MPSNAATLYTCTWRRRTRQGHSGSIDKKIQAIQDFDARIVGPILEGMRHMGAPFRMLVMPDHPTPIRKKTHTPIPSRTYSSTVPGLLPPPARGASPRKTHVSGVFVEDGSTMLARLIG
jgi:2,3-bisphosphoglycerate-independent phosphoglycerate mutase